MDLRRVGRRLLVVGAAGLVLGSGPLLLTILLNPSSTAVGQGLLFTLTFVPSCLILGVGGLMWLFASLGTKEPRESKENGFGTG